jgi:ribosomal protein S18 acetylase RimI-like enzyme
MSDMELHSLPTDEAVLRRQAEELWLPYHRDLEAAVDSHALADEVDLDGEVEFRRDLLESDSYRAWVAVDGVDDRSTVDLATDGTLAGFITTDVDPCPPVFDRPNRLKVGDIYVREQFRGTGLGRTLMERARDRAAEAGCGQLSLDVDVDNERALGFYETLGFEPHRKTLTLDVEEL